MFRIYWKKIPLELMAWIAGLVILMSIHPAEAHFSICPLAWIGLDFCPGCGLGKSVGYLFRGEVVESFKAHPLGMPAVAILIHRIYQLIKINNQLYGTNH